MPIRISVVGYDSGSHLLWFMLYILCLDGYTIWIWKCLDSLSKVEREEEPSQAIQAEACERTVENVLLFKKVFVWNQWFSKHLWRGFLLPHLVLRLTCPIQYNLLDASLKHFFFTQAFHQQRVLFGFSCFIVCFRIQVCFMDFLGWSMAWS